MPHERLTRLKIVRRPRQALQVALDLYLAAKEGAEVTERTLQNYREFLTPFLEWLRGQGVEDAASITTDHIRLYVLAFQRRGLVAATVHTALSASLADLIGSSMIKRCASRPVTPCECRPGRSWLW